MYTRIIRNDLKKTKTITLATTLFVAAAAMLVSLAIILFVSLFSSLDTLMTRAKTPHFMQMHAGQLDVSRLTSFAEQNNEVEKFQVLEFLNIDSSLIQLGTTSLANSIQDNGLSTQSKKFDYLLDLDGNPIHASDGELYVPIYYMKENDIQVGEQAKIAGKTFKVAGFLRDSQMNSSLSASKRFLVSENDYELLRNVGNTEHLIQFRLKDLSHLSNFEAAYASSGLEANGPTVTYPLFKMMNALSDGLMIAVILLVSILVVAIALLCIRFTLLAQIEEDYREIGVMKAIGLRVSEIRKLYLAKYMLITAVGSMLGLALSIQLKDLLLENIRLSMGESANASFAVGLSIIGILVVCLVIISYVNRVLKSFRKISAAEAIRFGTSQNSSNKISRMSLSRNKLFPTNMFLGINDVLVRKKLYMTSLVVLVLCTFILLVPQNLFTTISSSSFIQYMGIGNYDIRIDIQQTDDVEANAHEIAEIMKNDSLIAKVAVLTTKTFKVEMDDGSEGNMKIEFGDHTTFPIHYSEGRAPTSDNEIALSVINAEEMNKNIGDSITLLIDGNEKKLFVSGVYSDITNGGKTAKALFTSSSAHSSWSIVCAELLDSSLVDRKISEYARRFPFTKVANIDEFVMQTFGSTIHAIKKISSIAIVIALSIAILITILFMKMLIAKDKYSIAVLKTFGYTNTDIKVQYLSRSIIVLLSGIILGTLLANTVGEMLAGAVISAFGASTFHFTVNPFTAYVSSPLLLLVCVFFATLIGISSSKQITISNNIKE